MSFFGLGLFGRSDDGYDKCNRRDRYEDFDSDNMFHRSYLDDMNSGLNFRIEVEGDENYSFTNKKIPMIQNGHTYYKMHNRENYKVILRNDSDRRANVELYIDGEKMGKWRIDSYSHITIERPSDVNRKFVFVRENGWEAKMGGVRINQASNGLIEAKFIPEKVYDQAPYLFNESYNGNRGGRQKQSSYEFDAGMDKMYEGSHQMYSNNLSSSFSAGATVLGGDSSQSFGVAGFMTEDRSKIVIKKVRLVLNNDSSYPFTSIRKSDRSYDVIYEDETPPKFPRPGHNFRSPTDDFQYYLNGDPKKYKGYYSNERSF